MGHEVINKRKNTPTCPYCGSDNTDEVDVSFWRGLSKDNYICEYCCRSFFVLKWRNKI